MACDRFVNFKESRPAKAELEAILRNFLGGCGTVEWKEDRWFLDVPGIPTSMFNDVPGARFTYQGNEKRWIEVFWGKDNVDVITRQADNFTNALAAELASSLARFYMAELDDD